MRMDRRRRRARIGALLGIAGAIALMPGVAWAKRPRPASSTQPPTDGAATVVGQGSDVPSPDTVAAPVVPPPPAHAGAPTLVLHVGGLRELAPSVSAAMQAVLALDARVNVVPLDEVLDPSWKAEGELREAMALLAQARAAFGEMDLGAAKEKGDAAIAAMVKRLPRLAASPAGTTPLRDAWVLAATLRFFDADYDGAREALRHAFALDPLREVGPKALPPQMKKLAVEARQLADALGTGKLTVTSEPAGATVFLDGQPRGTTPLTIEELPAGPVYLQLLRSGWAPLATTLEVLAGDETRSEQTLTRWDDDPVTPLDHAWKDLAAMAPSAGKGGEATSVAPEAVLPPGQATPGLRDAAKRLGAPLVLDVHVGRGGKAAEGAPAATGTAPAAAPSPSAPATATSAAATGSIELKVLVYDQRPDKILRSLVETVSANDVETAARGLAQRALAGLALDGSYAPPRPPPPRSPLFATLRGLPSKRWFWPVVGGAAAVVVVGAAVGVGVGVAESQPRQGGLGPAETLILFGGR